MRVTYPCCRLYCSRRTNYPDRVCSRCRARIDQRSPPRRRDGRAPIVPGNADRVLVLCWLCAEPASYRSPCPS